ncbi:MAG: hypothetical protein JNK72_07990 [Myxococcales bacterium]|nr:hypothetical protein [Myxococcales bacterium]
MLSRVVLALAGLMLGQEALANGRFPNAGMVVRGRGASANTVMLQATFGVIVSRDRGASWQWICEEAYSEPSGWDPPIAVTASGALLLGMPDGLRNSSDGCSWHREGPALPVSDIAWDASLEHLVVAYASSFAPPAGVPLRRRRPAMAPRRDPLAGPHHRHGRNVGARPAALVGLNQQQQP